jgi:hypothetical protein
VVLTMTEHHLSERRACRLLEVDRPTYRYEPRPDRDAELCKALHAAADRHPRFGYRRLWVILTSREGWKVSCAFPCDVSPMCSPLSGSYIFRVHHADSASLAVRSCAVRA